MQHLLNNIKSVDANHKRSPCFRPQAEAVSRFLGLLDRFMAGHSTGRYRTETLSLSILSNLQPRLSPISFAVRFHFFPSVFSPSEIEMKHVHTSRRCTAPHRSRIAIGIHINLNFHIQQTLLLHFLLSILISILASMSMSMLMSKRVQPASYKLDQNRPEQARLANAELSMGWGYWESISLSSQQ